MKMEHPTRRLTLLLALAALLAVPAMADDTEMPAAEAPDMAAAMAAMAAAAAPGESHEFLAGLAGDWDFTSQVWMAPGQPPTTSGGKSTKSMIMGGRYLQEEVEGEMMGTTFHGLGLTAYDNTASEFVNTWLDDMSTAIAVSHGQRDGDTLDMHGEYLDPVTKQTMKVRAVVQVVDADHHIFQYYMTMPGAPEMKSMEIAYTRASE
jgi:Protein of unknown function (DUF1579)